MDLLQCYIKYYKLEVEKNKALTERLATQDQITSSIEHRQEIDVLEIFQRGEAKKHRDALIQKETEIQQLEMQNGVLRGELKRKREAERAALPKHGISVRTVKNEQIPTERRIPGISQFDDRPSIAEITPFYPYTTTRQAPP